MPEPVSVPLYFLARVLSCFSSFSPSPVNSYTDGIIISIKGYNKIGIIGPFAINVHLMQFCSNPLTEFCQLTGRFFKCLNCRSPACVHGSACGVTNYMQVYFHCDPHLSSVG